MSENSTDSQHQLDLELTLDHPQNVRKKQRVASAAIVIATDNLNREILPREGQGSIPKFRPQLDLGLDLGHPQIPREKKVPHIPPASPRAEAHNMNEWTSAEKGTGIAISDSSSRAPPGSPLLLLLLETAKEVGSQLKFLSLKMKRLPRPTRRRSPYWNYAIMLYLYPKMKKITKLFEF
ncbi:hypothetical protein H4Q26_007832 [Puccinia striiformis f. sp. tritici PST-130]|nr:hypothetical protein H4Q26_007832 [Puccinia striiformis f. sp. tritici PST-130]